MADTPHAAESVCTALAELIGKQLKRYQALARSARPPASAKPADVKAWEDTRKAAVLHLQALIRAGQMSRVLDGAADASDPHAFAALLAQAEADVAGGADGEAS